MANRSAILENTDAYLLTAYMVRLQLGCGVLDWFDDQFSDYSNTFDLSVAFLATLTPKCQDAWTARCLMLERRLICTLAPFSRKLGMWRDIYQDDGYGKLLGAVACAAEKYCKTRVGY